jgi:hypothetical protein
MPILSMDSYNRGYSAGIRDGINAVEGVDDGLGEAGSKIGNATVLNVPLPAGAQSTGFYAVAYQIEDDSISGLAQGSKVISYRGTDHLIGWSNLNPWSDTPGGDIWNSYGVGAGTSLTAAAHLAADFFRP